MIQSLPLILSAIWLLASTPVRAAHAVNPLPAVSVATRTSNSADSMATRATLMLQMSEFNLAWQLAWRESELIRQSKPGGRVGKDRRSQFVHCHPDGKQENVRLLSLQYAEPESVVYKHQLIASKESYYATCPTWLMTFQFFMTDDESNDHDVAILDSLREPVRELRATLIAQLDSAAAQFPGDGWITGHVTRFLLDQREGVEAMNRAAACRAERWWCAALRGYAYARMDNIGRADVAFREMQQFMTVAQQCAWDDARNLLPPSERKTYAAMPCDVRLQTNARLWWLADPLLRTAGNERWAEQQARRVELSLRTSLAQDERYTWTADYGGDALVTTLARYGWPSYTSWSSDTLDVGHTGYLAMHDSPRVSPYTTFEYALDRVHTLPTWQAVQSPFTAREESWNLSVDDYHGDISPSWWPDEHFRPLRRLVQLEEGQNAVFRRQSRILLAAAANLTHAALLPVDSVFVGTGAAANIRSSVPPARTKFDVLLMSSTSASNIDSLDQHIANGGATVVLQGLIAPSPAIIGFEARGIGPTAVDARARFGVTPPVPLDGLKPGQIASSDPVLLNAQNGGLDARSPNDDMLDKMLGSTHLQRGSRRVGVYWETYGIQADDTVTVAVSVQGDQDVGVLKRLGIATNVAADPNRAIVQRWTEPDVQHGTRTLAGNVAVQMRALVLNLTALPPGPYILKVSITRKDGAVATGSRRMTLDD